MAAPSPPRQRRAAACGGRSGSRPEAPSLRQIRREEGRRQPDSATTASGQQCPREESTRSRERLPMVGEGGGALPSARSGGWGGSGVDGGVGGLRLPRATAAGSPPLDPVASPSALAVGEAAAAASPSPPPNPVVGEAVAAAAPSPPSDLAVGETAASTAASAGFDSHGRRRRALHRQIRWPLRPPPLACLGLSSIRRAAVADGVLLLPPPVSTVPTCILFFSPSISFNLNPIFVSRSGRS
uniref:Uncharacterized protein n=1 Tax=Oryza meridionalis TaxID=40149 RepID=A0A0E0F1C5_9ORYZ